VCELSEEKLTKDIANDLPATHPHPKQDLVFHDKYPDAQECADNTGVAPPVIKERLQEGDHCMDVPRPLVERRIHFHCGSVVLIASESRWCSF